MAKVVSQKCPACNNMVRPDNPTFPYCRHHQGLASGENSMVHTSQSLSFTEVRETLYSPGYTKSKRSDVSLELSSDKSNGMDLSPEAMKGIVSVASEATQNTSPQDYARDINRHKSTVSMVADDVLGVIKKTSPQYKNPVSHVAQCDNSSVYVGTKAYHVPRPHFVACITSDTQPTLVVDIAPSVPVRSIPDIKNADSLDILSPGQSSFGNTMTIMPLYEYASFSPLNVDRIVDSSTGKSLWDSPVSFGKDSRDTVSQRNMLRNAPTPVFPAVEHKVSPRVGEQKNEQDDAIDDNLDEIFAQDL